MNPGDLAYLVIEAGTRSRRHLARGEDDEATAFVVESVSTDGLEAVIRWPDDEVELTVPVADLIPANSPT